MSDNDVIHKTGKISDAQIVKMFREIHDKFGSMESRFRYGSIVQNLDAAEKNVKGAKTHSFSKSSLTTTNKKFSVRYYRGKSAIQPNNMEPQIEIRIPDAFLDEIIIQVPPSDDPRNGIARPDIEECNQLEAIIAKYAKIAIPKEVDGSGLPAVELLQQELTSLSDLHQRMISTLADERVIAAAASEKRIAAIDAATEKQREEIAAAASSEQAVIEAQRKELEKAKNAIDDRDHMHVRRQLREQITSDIQTRIGEALLPKGSRRLGWGIFVFAIFCAVAAAIFASYSYMSFADLLNYKVTAETPEIVGRSWLIVVMVIRATLAAAVTLGFLIYALNWLRKKYAEDVRINNDLQRYALDINRASWVIETIMEMTSKEGRILPERWIKGATHGLFTNSDENEQSVTPLDALGALLNVTARAEIGPNGPTFGFERKGLEKAVKAHGK